MCTIEIKKSVDNQYYFIMKAANGQTVAISEMYTTKNNCKKGIRSARFVSIFAKTIDLT